MISSLCQLGKLSKEGQTKNSDEVKVSARKVEVACLPKAAKEMLVDQKLHVLDDINTNRAYKRLKIKYHSKVLYERLLSDILILRWFI